MQKTKAVQDKKVCMDQKMGVCKIKKKEKAVAIK